MDKEKTREQVRVDKKVYDMIEEGPPVYVAIV